MSRPSAATACVGALVASPISFVDLIALRAAARLALGRAASIAAGAVLIGATAMVLVVRG